MKLNDFIEKVDYITPEMIGESLYERYQQAAEWLRSHHSECVTGLWHINMPADDGGIQAIIRYDRELPFAFKGEVHAAVGDLIHHESLWVISPVDNSGIDHLLEEFFFTENIFCVFDSRRT